MSSFGSTSSTLLTCLTMVAIFLILSIQKISSILKDDYSHTVWVKLKAISVKKAFVNIWTGFFSHPLDKVVP
jgi:hypothetical protein